MLITLEGILKSEECFDVSSGVALLFFTNVSLLPQATNYPKTSGYSDPITGNIRYGRQHFRHCETQVVTLEPVEMAIAIPIAL